MKQEHVEQARHNAGFLAYLESSTPDSFYDWKVTVCFYQTLHLIRAYLCTQGVTDSDNHDHTLNCINPGSRERLPKHVPMPTVYKAYFRLYQLAKNSRYNGFLQKRSFDQQQLANLQTAKACLEAIKQEFATRNFQWEPAPKAA